MIVVTWNVLHRIHAVNWSESAVEAWPDEAARIRAIAEAVAGFAADVICLQEVSGDQLAVLRAANLGEVFAHPYPRVPAYRGEVLTLVRDPTEYLVTIVRDRGATATAEAFPADRGKGFLRIDLASGATVINTHVTYGDKRTDQLARLLATMRTASGLTVVCGDFNADQATIAAALGIDFIAASPAAPALPTRPRSVPSDKSQTIDHLFVRGGRILEAHVLHGAGRSDHNPLRARVAE